jgi:molecular chaperone GrpE (heat shock protein)
MKRQRKTRVRRRASLNGNPRVEASIEIGTELAPKSPDNSRIAVVARENLTKDMATIATSVWKARSRMVDPGSGEVREEMKRVYGDIERIQRCLDNLGIAVEDHTNKPFDYGLPWQVVATKPMPGHAREIVTETLKPTVRWNEQIIQHAEVEIGTPA